MNPKIKAILIIAVTVTTIVGLIAVAAAVSTPHKVPSTVLTPNGIVPTPTPEPTATPIPTPTPTIEPTPSPTSEPLTDTFTVTATLNGTLTNPENIVIPEGALVGDVYTVVYTFVSTANQPITVTASVPEGQQVTGNQLIVWDATTVQNSYSVSLPIGASATMTMTVTVGTVGGSIPLMFTANP